MRNNIFSISMAIAVSGTLLVINAPQAQASDRDESGAILRAMVCAVLGCKVGPSTNDSSHSRSDSGTMEPQHPEKRPAGDIGKMLLFPFTPIGRLWHGMPDPLYTVDALGVVNSVKGALALVAKGHGNTYQWLGSGFCDPSMANMPQCKVPWKTSGTLTLIKAGKDAATGDFCVHYLSVITRKLTKPWPGHKDQVERVEGVACDNFDFEGAFKESNSRSIQWTDLP